MDLSEFSELPAGLVPGQQGPEDPLVKYAGMSEAERAVLHVQLRAKVKAAMKDAGRWHRHGDQDLKNMPLGHLEYMLDYYQGFPGGGLFVG